jgi:hypothetical protein
MGAADPSVERVKRSDRIHWSESISAARAADQFYSVVWRRHVQSIAEGCGVYRS